jgi:hypothetical protein
MDLSQVVNPRWLSATGDLRSQFASSVPFPSIVMDDFLTPAAADLLRRASCDVGDFPVSFRTLAQKKHQLCNLEKEAPAAWPIISALNGDGFVSFLESVSGVHGLCSDPTLAAAGFHRYYDRGFAELHVDANYHPLQAHLHRRLNILIYLNPGWEPGWGGELLLWSSRGRSALRAEQSIVPLHNRAVVFLTTRTSWHSVNMIKCPAGASRNSLALFFFSRDRPIEEQWARSSNIWSSRNNMLRRICLDAASAALTLAKPLAPYLRKLRRDKFR